MRIGCLGVAAPGGVGMEWLGGVGAGLGQRGRTKEEA